MKSWDELSEEVQRKAESRDTLIEGIRERLRAIDKEILALEAEENRLIFELEDFGVEA